MRSRTTFVTSLLILLLLGGSSMSAGTGPGERIERTRNCPDGIAVTTHVDSRRITIESVDSRKLKRFFSDAAGDTPSPGRDAGTQLRRRTVSLRRDQLFTAEERDAGQPDSYRLKDMLRLNLFPGLEVRAYLSRVDQTLASFTWVGRIDGRADRGTANLTVRQGSILGRVNIYGEGIFSIRPTGDGLYEIVELDYSKARFAPPIYPPEEQSRSSSPDPGVSHASDGIIEIMVVWSTDAQAAAAAGGTSIQAEIALAVSLINTTYENSGISQRVQLVESAAAGYTAGDDSETDLYRLQDPNDGYMDEIHLLRLISKADCVSLITDGWSGNIIGQGFALKANVSSFFKNYAFSVVDRHAFNYQTLTHELGHNMGAGHELDNPSSPGPQYYSYSSGYHYPPVTNDSVWHTMMSYRHGGSYKIEHFSNPDVSFEGNPTGLPGSNGNNNALTLNNTSNLVDSFGEDLAPDLASCYLASADFYPGAIESFEELEIYTNICNNGEGPATAFSVDFYASPDMTLTTDDFFLGRVAHAGIEAYDVESITWSGPLDGAIPSGEYYLGWVIDPDGQVPESEEGNNISLILSSPLEVTQVQDCSYSLSPSSQNYSYTGGSSSFNVITDAGCDWHAESEDAWISVRPGTEEGTGSGTVIYDVAPNSSYFQRTGRIEIEDEYFIVVQNGMPADCSVTLSPESRTHSAEAEGGSISVEVPAVCSWSASASEDWITITAGDDGTGDGVIIYTIGENRGMDERSGSIQVENAVFSVFQESPYTNLEKSDLIVFPAAFSRIGSLFENSYVGATMLNLNPTPKVIEFSGLDEEGSPQQNNSSIPPLQPNGQLARLTSELVMMTPELTTVIGQGDGSGSPVRGIFTIGDSFPRRLEGIGNRWLPSKELYLLQGWEETGQETAVFLFNTSTASSSQVLIEWKSPAGMTIGSAEVEIEAEGTLFQTCRELFESAGGPQVGYLKITSSTEVSGFTLAGNETSFTAFPSLPARMGDSLYAPHFILLEDGSGTEVQLINAGKITAKVTLRSFGPPGFELESDEIELLPGAMLKGPVTQYLPFDLQGIEEGEIVTGEILFSIVPAGNYDGLEAPKVIGGVRLSGGEHTSAGLVLEREGWKNTIFPHIAQSDEMGIFTGLAIWNINSQPAEITLRAFRPDGSAVAETSFQLDSGERRIGLLDEAFYFDSEFSQVGGHLEISSSLPVVSFCLFGDAELEYLATISGQELVIN